MSTPETDLKPSRFHKKCRDPLCNAWVHSRVTHCPKCNAISPWNRSADVIPPHIVIEDFTTNLGISLQKFRLGQVLTDGGTITQLLAQGCAIKPKTDADHVLVCPSCKATFLSQMAREATTADTEPVPPGFPLAL